jgi:C4-dicarboxylate-specific signal transduction histidine kinase
MDQIHEISIIRMYELLFFGRFAVLRNHTPIAAARNNARAALNYLDKQPPDPDEAKEALHSIVGDADRAGEIIDRIRDHIKKAPPRKSRFDLNEAINEVILLARSGITTNGVSVQTRLAEVLRPVEGDRVHCNRGSGRSQGAFRVAEPQRA